MHLHGAVKKWRTSKLRSPLWRCGVASVTPCYFSAVPTVSLQDLQTYSQYAQQHGQSSRHACVSGGR